MFNPEMYQPARITAIPLGTVEFPRPDDFSSYHVSVSRSHTTADGTKFSGDMDARGDSEDLR